MKRTDFFEQDGVWYVNANNRVYQVSTEAHYRIISTDAWFEGEDAMTQMRAYSNDMTIYVDPIGHRVRFVTSK